MVTRVWTHHDAATDHFVIIDGAQRSGGAPRCVEVFKRVTKTMDGRLIQSINLSQKNRRKRSITGKLPCGTSDTITHFYYRVPRTDWKKGDESSSPRQLGETLNKVLSDKGEDAIEPGAKDGQPSAHSTAMVPVDNKFALRTVQPPWASELGPCAGRETHA